MKLDFARFKATWKKLRDARQPIALSIPAAPVNLLPATVAKAQENLNPQLIDLGNLLGLPAAAQRISARENLRDMNSMMHERMQQVCFFLAVTTPFGRRIIRIIVDHIVGEGFKAIAEDEGKDGVQEVLNGFWDDPINNMDENVDALAQELLIFGELCIPVAVNEVDGSVRLGYIDPQEILEIEFGKLVTSTTGESEISIPIAVRLKAKPTEGEGRRLTIIRPDDDPESPTFGRLRGQCFYFAINKAKSASRGISELFALADWIDVFDQMVFDYADRLRFLNAFVWDYTIKGADPKMVEAFKAELLKSPPRQGGVQVHNDQVTIAAATPDLKGADMSEAAKVVKQYGLGGAGMPSWFFADPGDANRAVAQEMAGPTGKMLTNKQNVMKRVFVAIGAFVIDQAVVHGVLSESADLRWKLQVPDISVQDTAAVATALQTLATALATGEDRGWVRGKTAGAAFATVLTQVGVEIEADEYDLAQEEKTSRDATAQNDLNSQKNLADALAAAGGQPATELVQ